MKTVSRFEANVLCILRFFLRRGPREQALPLIYRACDQPPCLGADAVTLVQDSLAKGCMAILARAGGWRKEKHLRGEQIAEGRLWERTPPAELGLKFSSHALDFLIWITAQDPTDEKTAWKPPRRELTVADQLLLYLAHAAMRDAAGPKCFERGDLCRLAFPDDVEETTQPDFTPWTAGLGACILEALQPELAEHWRNAEIGKARMKDWKALQKIGERQTAVLECFLDAVETAGRLDLTDFLLQTLARLLTPNATARLWVNEEVSKKPPRMADRLDLSRAALALVRQMERFRRWQDQSRGVGYLDEGYAASQLTKAAWERHGGEELHARARAIVREIDPLRVHTEDQP